MIWQRKMHRPSRVVHTHCRRLIGALLAWDKGPKNQEEANHPDQPWNKLQNDGGEHNRGNLTKGVESRYPS